MADEELPQIITTEHPQVIYWLAICATLSGLLLGYDTGIINGAIVLIDEQFKLTRLWMALIVSSAIFSAAIFSFVSGIIADHIGRKLTIMISAIIFSVGGGIMGVASGTVMLLTGRLIVGASIGIVSCVVPVYISECAPADIRGRLVTLNQLFITVGIVISALMSAVLQELGEVGWRWMLGIAAVPGVFQFIFFFSLPESPRFQMMKHQDVLALNTMRRIRGKNDVIIEIKEIRKNLEDEEENTTSVVLKKMFETHHVRKALFIGCTLQIFQQFSGINTVIYYSAIILKSAGFERFQALWLACLPAVINCLATFIGLWAVETTGRKLILALSFSAIAVALGVLFFGFAMSQTESPPASPTHEKRPLNDHCSEYKSCFDCTQNLKCGYCTSHTNDDAPLEGACISVSKTNHHFAAWGRCSPSNSSDTFKEKNVMWAYETCLTVYSYFAIAGLILFVLSFAPGAGPMPWTINAEIYPSWCRSLSNSIATVTNWTCNLIVSVSFLALIDTITIWGTFLFFAVVCVAAAIFVVIFVPETKDKSLEDIQYLFMNSEEKLQIETKHSTLTGSRHSKHSLMLHRSQATLAQPTVIQPMLFIPNTYRTSTGSTVIY